MIHKYFTLAYLESTEIKTNKHVDQLAGSCSNCLESCLGNAATLRFETKSFAIIVVLNDSNTHQLLNRLDEHLIVQANKKCN